VDIIPLRPKFEIPISKVQTALLTKTEETLEDSDLTHSLSGLKKVYHEVEKILDHRGTKNKEFLVRWKGYDSDEVSWRKEKDVTQSVITEYRQYLKNKTRHTHNSTTHT
jgi:hypothetical protein